MSEITELKKQIIQKLSQVNDRRQLRNIQKMMDRLGDLQAFLNNPANPMPRSEGVVFYRENINMENLPTDGGAESLKSLVEQALTEMETLEKKIQ